MSFIKNPRVVQLSVLTSLFVYLSLNSDFTVPLAIFATYVLSGLLAQLIFCRFYSVRFDPLSIMISCVSLSLLLRTESMVLAASASLIAVGSKFFLRLQNKHIFNPSNLAIVVALVLVPEWSWVSPSQWGREVIFAFALASIGFLLVKSVSSLWISLSFIAFYLALKFTYAFYMGDPISIPLLALSNGGLYLFTFYMITDPKTSPNHWAGRLVYTGSTALIANYLELFRFWPTGVFHALVIVCLFVPLLDRIWRGQIFNWNLPTMAFKNNTKERV